MPHGRYVGAAPMEFQMMIKPFISIFFAVMSAIITVVPANSYANIIITGTRLIYPAQKKEITVKTQNPGSLPALAQVWIDEGDSSVRAQDSEAPFVITPPLIRLEANGGQTFRILYVPGEKELPEDVESLFYFNLLDVPPMPEVGNSASSSYIQMAYRSRLKFFYRPVNLPQHPNQAAEMLQWNLAQNDSGLSVLRVHNPSAYHVSFNGISLLLDNLSYPVAGEMIAPGASGEWLIEGLRAVPVNAQKSIEFNWINDYGGLVKQNSLIQP